MTNDRYMTVREIADMLRIKETTVRTLFATGQLPGVKVGMVWRAKREELEQFLSSRRPK